MTDRQLLELAAKAAKYEIAEYQDGTEQHHLMGEVFILNNYAYWNPLTDDGDALRLAVKFQLQIEHCDYEVVVTEKEYDSGNPIGAAENNAHDPYAATRRAIVRAAAEVGKGMLTHDEFILMFPGSFDDDTVSAAEIRKSLPPLPEEQG